MKSVDDVFVWLASAKRGTRHCYHDGWLARDRLARPGLAQVADALYALSDGSTLVVAGDGGLMPKVNMNIVRLSQQRIEDHRWFYWAELRVKPTAEEIFLVMQQPRIRLAR